jgi:hypothetical protein
MTIERGISMPDATLFRLSAVAALLAGTMRMG